MLKMGRQPKVSDEKAILLIQNYIEYFADNDLPPSGDPVYEQMSRDVNGAWKAHSVYTHIRNNKKNHLQDARAQAGINIEPPSSSIYPSQRHQESHALPSKDYSLVSEDGDELDTTFECEDNQHTLEDDFKKSKLQEFSLRLSKSEWDKIKPNDNATESQKRRLKPHVWANVLCNAIWTRYALKCGFIANYSYLRPRYSNTDDFFLSFKMCCKNERCLNELIGLGKMKPADDGTVFLAFKCKDTRDSYHEKVKRPLNGVDRKEVGEKLLRRRAGPFQDEQIKCHVKFGQDVPAFIQDKHIYRQTKSESVKESLGLPKKQKIDMISAIQSLGNDPLYRGCIRFFNITDFAVSFCTKEQIYIFKEYLRCVKNSQVCLDATGKIIKKFYLGFGKTGHIFLYTVTINFENETIPVLQLLTERHDEVFISFRLTEWFSSLNISPPKTVVTDQGRALMLSACDTFNHQTLKQYIDNCFLWAIGSRDLHRWPANTMIRLDVAHFMKTVVTWKSIQSLKIPAVKSFFIRLMALMIDCQSVDEFKDVFQLTCVVATHKNNDTLIKIPGKKELTVQQARQHLEQCLVDRGNVIDILEEYVLDDSCIDSEKKLPDEVEDNDLIYNGKTTITHQWIKKLITESCSCVDEPAKTEDEMINKFYFKDFLPDLERKGKEFVLWTGAAIPDGRQHASTASQEGFFSMFKTRVFEGVPLPCSAVRFIQTFLQYIDVSSTRLSDKLSHYNHEIADKDEFLDELDTSEQLFTPTNSQKICLNQYYLNDSDYQSKETWYGLKNNKMPFFNNQNHYDEFSKDNNADEDDDTSHLGQVKLITPKNQDEELFKTINTSFNENKSSGLLEKNDASIQPLCHAGDQMKVMNNNLVKEEIQIKKIQEPSHYFKSCPEIKIINKAVDMGHTSKSKGCLIPNGNVCSIIKIEGLGISLRNSCPHDSLIQILLFGAINYQQYLTAIQTSKNRSLKFITDVLRYGIIHETLELRIQILNDYYDLVPMGKNSLSPFQLDAFDSISGVISKLFLTDQETTEESVTKNYHCSTVGCIGRETRKLPMLSLDFKKFNDCGFQQLEKSINYQAIVKNLKCSQKNCKGRLTETTILNKHIIIETDTRRNNSETRKTHQLAEFPIDLKLDHQDRSIGAIHYHEPQHFVAYCRKLTGTWL